MKIVWLVSDDKLNEVRSKLMADEVVNRHSITIRSARSLDFNKDGNYLFLNGSEDAVERAKELVAESVQTIEEDEVNEVISRIEEAEDSVAAGLGGIFG
jgi:uncharacterized protein YaaQ